MQTQNYSRSSKIGVLLLNLGSPQAPTPQAVKSYLAEFLSDPYVVDYPRWLWMPLLKGIILRTRPARSAALYQRIWTEQGSPLILISNSIARKLEERLNQTSQNRVLVKIGMRYGQPAIRAQIESLVEAGIQKLVVLPLFPQYSTTTTQTALDVVQQSISALESGFPLEIIHDYHDHPAYIDALAASIEHDWAEHGKPDKLLLSFHGVPKRYCQFDPYAAQCERTADLLAARLALPADGWRMAFQSRFGPEAWLQPYTDELLHAWGKTGVKSVSVAAPGFAVDCLETLDELGREAREVFLEAGGGTYRYIPALNDAPQHLEALESVLNDKLRPGS